MSRYGDSFDPTGVWMWVAAGKWVVTCDRGGVCSTERNVSSHAYAMYFYRAMLSIRGTSHGPVSVCPSQVGVLSKRLNESSCFLHVSFLPPILHCIKRKFGYLQNKGTSFWNFVLNSGLKKFRHGISIVQTCYQLSSRKVDAHSVINWTVVGQLSR